MARGDFKELLVGALCEAGVGIISTIQRRNAMKSKKSSEKEAPKGGMKPFEKSPEKGKEKKKGGKKGC